MIAVKIGAKDDSPQRPNVLFMATYHAREWAATEMALRLIKYLAALPGSNPRVDSLVQTRDIWILPVANPDGYEYTFTGDRLSLAKDALAAGFGGAFGVDMNRNHRQNWGLDEMWGPRRIRRVGYLPGARPGVGDRGPEYRRVSCGTPAGGLRQLSHVRRPDSFFAECRVRRNLRGSSGVPHARRHEPAQRGEGQSPGFVAHLRFAEHRVDAVHDERRIQ